MLKLQLYSQDNTLYNLYKLLSSSITIIDGALLNILGGVNICSGGMDEDIVPIKVSFSPRSSAT